MNDIDRLREIERRQAIIDEATSQYYEVRKAFNKAEDDLRSAGRALEFYISELQRFIREKEWNG